MAKNVTEKELYLQKSWSVFLRSLSEIQGASSAVGFPYPEAEHGK